MTRLLPLSLTAFATSALAHPAHIAAEAGHNHYVAVAATGLAAAIVAAGLVRAFIRRRRRLTQHG